MIKPVRTDNAPQAIGPYSQAVVWEQFIFCSGQIGIDPATGVLVDGIEAQTRQVITNLIAVLGEANVDLSSVVKATIYVVSIEDFTKVNEIYGQFFGDHKPARATVAVTALPKGALIEIDAIAVKS